MGGHGRACARTRCALRGVRCVLVLLRDRHAGFDRLCDPGYKYSAARCSHRGPGMRDANRETYSTMFEAGANAMQCRGQTGTTYGDNARGSTVAKGGMWICGIWGCLGLQLDENLGEGR